MNFFQILLGAAVGTSCMTLFSYAMSRIRGKQFREPELLNELLVRARLMKFQSSINHPVGWWIHYAIGLGFVFTYYLLALLTAIELTFAFFVIAGAISGLIGICAWHLTFRLHPNSPGVDLNEFYIQLEIAHVIFGAFVYIGDVIGNY